ncbi:MAG: hypothetical protein Kow0099_26090 [Candidatus Abyssubacteria bacterium]
MLALCLLFCVESVASAIEPGAKALPFTLTSLTGESVGPLPTAKGQVLLLYFFDSAADGTAFLSPLSESSVAASSPFSILGISRSSAQTLKEHLQPKLHPLVLLDDKGVTYDYGLSKRLPACVVIGPEDTIAAVLTPVKDHATALLTAGHTFMSMGLPVSASNLYDLVPEKWGHEREIARWYAHLLDGKAESAVAGFAGLAASNSEYSAEGHAGLAFFHYREGKDGEALAECGRAPSHGFAILVRGLVEARQGDCAAASSSFEKAAAAQYLFAWQKAMALNLAANVAETKNDQNAALQLYKRAFDTAPLNPYIAANLLFLNWRQQNYPAAALYADIITASGISDPLVDALVDEYKAQVAFARDSHAKRLLEKKPPKTPGKPEHRSGRPFTMLVSDFPATGCPAELAGLSVASSGLLQKCFEESWLRPIKRAEWQEAARRLNPASTHPEDPLQLREVARALSVDLLTFGVLGTYAGSYVLNVRIADVNSGAVIAVASERFQTLHQLPQAMTSAARKLTEQTQAHYGRP